MSAACLCGPWGGRLAQRVAGARPPPAPSPQAEVHLQAQGLASSPAGSNSMAGRQTLLGHAPTLLRPSLTSCSPTCHGQES